MPRDLYAWLSYVLSNHLNLWRNIAYLIALLMLTRGVTTAINLPTWDVELWPVFKIGLRFDLKSAAILMAPLWLLAWIPWQPAIGLLRKAIRPYTQIVAVLFVWIGIGNAIYLQIFGKPFDLFVFNLLDENLQGLAADAAENYPVIQIVIGLIITGVLAWRFTPKLQAIRAYSRLMSLGILSILAVAYVWGVRGGFGLFPLTSRQAAVTDNLQLNQLPINGPMALFEAYEAHANSGQFPSVSDSEFAALAQAALGQPTLEIQTDALAPERPPHLVYTMLESFGSNLIAFDQPPAMDLLGKLRDRSEQDWLFRRVLPVANGTIDTLVGTFAQSYNVNIASSKAQSTRLDSSFFTHLTTAGYEISFITAGQQNWQNVGPYFSTLGAGKVFDTAQLIRDFPDAAQDEDDWGVDDEYVYRKAVDILANATRPQLLVLMTATNHGPYTLPKAYTGATFDIPQSLIQRYSADTTALHENLQTYRYTADAYATFLNTLDETGLSDQTVLIATGDHRARNITVADQTEIVLDHAVPLWLTAPKHIIETSKGIYDPNRIGSHKDILPTFVDLALADHRYLSYGGESLIQPSNRPFGYNSDVMIFKEGAVSLSKPDTLYPWQNNGLLTDTVPINNPHEQFVRNYDKLWKKGINYFVGRGINFQNGN